MTIGEKVAYLKGLAEGMAVDSETKEGKLFAGILDVLSDIENGKVEFLIDAEDIHMNVEKLLTDKIGDAGKRLHTGRSRNGERTHKCQNTEDLVFTEEKRK